MAILALQAMEDETCPCGCGQPMSECCDDNGGPDYEAHAQTCRAGEVLARARKDAAEGEMVYVIPVHLTDDDLAAEREAERQALAGLRANSREG